MLEISHIAENSPAFKAGMKPGDRLATLNGEDVADQLDFQYHLDPGDNLLEMASGELIDIYTQTASRESLGIEFVPMEIRRCGSNCVFCFVNQLPRGLRRDLYTKDDDFRLSFLDGCFITGENLSEIDISRILKLRLSPLYFSVHAAEPETRGKMFGKNSPAPVLPLLSRFASSGISLHIQIVVCPGLNDGPMLEKTLDELAELGDSIESVGVVPVGLTKFRKDLPLLKPVDKKAATEVLGIIAGHNRSNTGNEGRVVASDEFYILAGVDFPGVESYGEFPQIGNGVGLTVWWESIFRETEMEMHRMINSSEKIESGYVNGDHPPVDVLFITGELAAPYISTFGKNISLINRKLNIKTLAVQNRFLGRSISISALLGGADIARTIRNQEKSPEVDSEGMKRETSSARFAVLPPELMNNDGITLDGMTLANISETSGAPCVCAPGDPHELAGLLVSLYQDDRPYPSGEGK